VEKKKPGGICVFDLEINAHETSVSIFLLHIKKQVSQVSSANVYIDLTAQQGELAIYRYSTACFEFVRQ
jgi:hypothetical protein